MPEGFRQALYRSVHSHFALRGIGQLRPFAAAEASRAGIDDTSFSPVSRYRSRSVAAENVPAQMLGSVTLGLDAFCYELLSRRTNASVGIVPSKRAPLANGTSGKK